MAAVLLSGATGAQAFDHEALAQRALDDHILPGYAHFADAAKRFSETSAALCEAPSSQALAKTRSAAKDALLAWGRIEHIRFGPITENQRFDRLLFYPDPRGIARKQIARLLKHQDDHDLDPAKLAHASVAVQGFSALDQLLYGKASAQLAGTGKAGAFRCRYVHALAEAMQEIVGQTLVAWSGPFREIWLHPGPDNPTFLKAEETTQALLRSYVTELEVVRLQRLAPMIGTDGQSADANANPLLAQSGLGMAFVIANVEGIRALLTESGFVDPDFATNKPERTAMGVLGSVVTDLGFALRAGRNAIKAAPDPLASAKARALLPPMMYSLKNAEETGRAALGTLTGSMLGFNSLDGD
jgi:uncharacterized protein